MLWRLRTWRPCTLQLLLWLRHEETRVCPCAATQAMSAQPPQAPTEALGFLHSSLAMPVKLLLIPKEVFAKQRMLKTSSKKPVLLRNQFFQCKLVPCENQFVCSGFHEQGVVSLCLLQEL